MTHENRIALALLGLLFCFAGWPSVGCQSPATPDGESYQAGDTCGQQEPGTDKRPGESTATETSESTQGESPALEPPDSSSEPITPTDDNTPEPTPEPQSTPDEVTGEPPIPDASPDGQEPAPDDGSQPEPTTEPTPEKVAEAVPEKTAWLPTWQDDPCAKAPAPGYGSTVARWVAQDQLRPPPSGGIVVTGSSSIRLWKRLQLDLNDWQVIQRGYGGSLLWDAAGNAAKIIIPYRPRLVLVYAGTNDVSKGTPPAQVLLAYRCLVQRIRQGLGHIHIAFIGITPNPSRWSQWSKATQVNDGVKALAQAWPGLHYIDIPSAFLKTGQPPDASLFVSDRLHLNDKGYTLWTSVIRPALRQITQPLPYTAPMGQPASGSRALIDLGPTNTADGDPTKSPDSAGNHWNSWHTLQGGSTTYPGEALSLKTTSGTTTPWRLVLGGQFLCNGKRNGGLANPDPKALGALAVATATQDYFYTQAASGAQGMTFDGLDPSRTYDLTLFASRSTDQETRETEYTLHSAGGIATQRLVTTGRNIGTNGTYDGNDAKVITFTGQRPTASGKLHLEIRASKGSFGYLAAMSLTVK